MPAVLWVTVHCMAFIVNWAYCLLQGLVCTSLLFTSPYLQLLMLQEIKYGHCCSSKAAWRCCINHKHHCSCLCKVVVPDRLHLTTNLPAIVQAEPNFQQKAMAASSWLCCEDNRPHECCQNCWMCPIMQP